MNIYDFDDTIYEGDSCRDIVMYGLKKHPILTLKSLIKANSLNKKYKSGKIPFERVKEEMLSFIFKIPNYKSFINDFVNQNIKKIKPWYLSRKKDNDVIVSASYELWLNVFAHKIGVRYVIGTKTNNEGKIIGKNCKREEKIRRLNEIYPHASINACYSDSASDIPLLELSEISYVVEGNKIVPYKKGYKFKNRR